MAADSKFFSYGTSKLSEKTRIKMPVSFCYCYCHHKNQLFEDSYTYVHKYSKWRVHLHHNVDLKTNFFSSFFEDILRTKMLVSTDQCILISQASFNKEAPYYLSLASDCRQMCDWVIGTIVSSPATANRLTWTIALSHVVALHKGWGCYHNI